MRALALAGLIALAFGLGSYYATGERTPFATLNLAAGALALAAAGAFALRRLRFAAGSHSRRVLLRGLLGVAAAIAGAIALERAAAWTGWRSDLTFEQSFELAPATIQALAELPEPLSATLYHDRFDPRARGTRLLLESLAREGPVQVRARLIADAPDEVDHFGIASSNTVVLELGQRFETIERPLETTLYEGLSRLRSRVNGVIGVLRGEGEGDVSSEGELGFSGLAAALASEGYQLRSLVTASLREIPEDVDAVLLLAPQRALLPTSIEALERYLERGGRVVALLEPGAESGAEPLLARWGIEPLAGVIIDPASGEVSEGVPGVAPIAYNYESHPLASGLNPDRMTYFSGARPLAVHNTAAGDNVRRVVLASPRSWVTPDLSVLSRRGDPPLPGAARQDYHAIAAAGRYPRPGGEARLVVFGDSDFASNRYLRALYNLDLVLNAVHWAVERESQITLRPKLRTPMQFPLPIENTLRTFHGVGLLVPELLLVAGGLVWLRRRAA
jgi:ABC-type uncharacterized transport system involved in gliding motility auxiliary subunit